MTRTLFRALAALACGSCANPTAPKASIELVTDRAEYLFDRLGGPRIDLTVRNISSSTAKLSGCDGLVFPVPEADLGDHWKAFTLVSCGPYQPVELAPGESIVLWGSVPGVGTFRLRVPVFVSSSEQRLDASTSNEFTVR
jgi:hypothetical protein